MKLRPEVEGVARLLEGHPEEDGEHEEDEDDDALVARAPPMRRSVAAIHPEIAPKATGMMTSVQATSPRDARQM